MGKSIRPQPLIIFPKKGILTRKFKNTRNQSDAITALRKKPDYIETYLRTLSNNYGSNNVPIKTTTKRKFVEESEEMPKAKKSKLEGKYFEKNTTILNITETTKFEYLSTHLEYKDEVKDLFHIDDTKCSNEHTYYVDWLHQLCEEISLEGLDGITVEALWSRMKSCSTHPVLIEGREEIFWNLLKYLNQVEFYILDQPRGNLMIYDKNSYVCPDTGIVLEPMIDYGEIYPYSMVNKNGVRGSCQSYNTRMENSAVIRKLGLKEALNIYGNRLVIVANQKMREHAIISEIADPMIELMDNEYGLLERVGRARGFGELTQGKVSVLNMIKDSRSIFHVRKSLEGKKLLKKQFFVLRNAASGQNKTGKLLHLPRFYRLQKNKTLLLIEEIVDLLRQKPDYSLDFGEFRKYFPQSTGVNKILKIPEFTKYIKTDIYHPYRFLYPNATVQEWRYKNKNKEKLLRIFQLIDPTINVAATWNNADNEDNVEDEQIYEEGQGCKFMDLEFSWEVFSAIFKTGKQGITLQELVKILNYDYYTIRIDLRKLQAKNIIDTLRVEQGKQRHIYYFARCFHSKNLVVPVTKTRDIPENVLQKLLRDKKTFEDKLKTNIVTKSFGYKSSNYTLHCSALKKNETVQNKETSEREVAIILKKWTIPSSTFSVFLPDIRIIPKFCEITYESIKQIRALVESKNIITSYSSHETVTQMMLFNSLITGININIENILKGNCINSCDVLDLHFQAEANVRKKNSTKNSSNRRDFLLGSTPVQISQEKTAENIEISITQSTPPEKYIYDYQEYVSFDRNLTALSLARTNMILKEVNKNLIIADIYKLQRMMTESEMEPSDRKKESQGRMDKNTLHRILLRLINEGYIKIFKLFMLSKEKYKTQWLIAHPSVDITHPLLVSTKEQTLIKFFLGMDRRTIPCSDQPAIKKVSEPSPFDNEEVIFSIQTLEQISKTKPTVVYKQNRLYGRILGYQPKFVRMQLFHELLYYLIYDYEPLDQLSHNDLHQIHQHYNTNELHELPPIYRKTIDWKMFIPPLPLHKNFTNGWTLLCDVILSIPLSLWVKLFHISIECPKLVSYMEHPIRQHYLIKYIPIEFRHILMHRRKYLFNAVELTYRLCFIGLAQLGPQSPVIKDQIFLYLNRNASLLDTSSSGPSYHKITEKKYEEVSFNFCSSADVENYWCQLWTISMNTPLGQRNVMMGKSITVETSTYKTMLLDSLKVKTPEEALANDNGNIPGDKRGAGGLDSSMWSHIKRNWLWSSKVPKSNISSEKEKQGLRGANIAGIKPLPIKYKELMSSSKKVYMTNINKRTKCMQTGSKAIGRKKAKIIHVFQTKAVTPKIRRDEMDAKDKAIINNVGKLFRAKFNKKEEKILYICRAANCFLTKNRNIYKASRFLIRDILHLLVPESHDKTSGACARRLQKLERSDIFMKRIAERAYELMSLKDLSTYFAPIIFNFNKLASSHTYSQYSTMDKNVVFIHAVWYIYRNYDLVWRILQGHANHLDFFSPNNIETFGTLVVNTENKKSVFSSPSSQGDIEKDAVKSVLMSALSCSVLGQNISYQFYQICKKYSDQAIRAAVSSSKGYQAISVRKPKPNGSIIRSIPFKLSITYSHMQKSRISCRTIHTIYQHFLKDIKESPQLSEEDITSICTYSRMLSRNEVATIWPRHRITLDIPESAQVLSLNIENRSFLVTKLAELYQKYLKNRVEDFQNPLKKPKRVHNRITMNIIQPTTNCKRFVVLKSNIKKFMSNLPWYFNKPISENLSLFLDCKEEEEINRCLKIILNELIKITTNLFTSEPGGCKLLQSYVSRFYRVKTIDSVVKDLEFKICKLCWAIRTFLQTHDVTDSIDCFEDKLLRKDDQVEYIIYTWLDKTKMKYITLNTNEHKAYPKQKRTNSFFKFNMNKVDNSVKIISNIDDVPNLEDIERQMLEPSTNFKRSIPHISDVVCLLSQERCSNPDEEKLLDELRENFNIEYPTLDEFEMENLFEFKDLFKYLFHGSSLPDLEKIVYRYCHTKESNTIEMIERFKEKGGTACDHLLAGEIISYVYNTKCLGASGQEIKKTFKSRQSSLDLHVIIEILCDSFILLEVGITEKTFVHVEHGNSWLVETFHLSPQEKHLLHEFVNDDLQKLQQTIESRIRSSKPVTVIMMPWLHLDGTLNKPVLNKWLTNVLSFSLELPHYAIEELFEKFYLLKPVELFCILKILQELKCLQIMALDEESEDLTHDAVYSKIRPATILDSFSNMFIEVNPLATVNLGHYLYAEVDHIV